ncbi:Gypsy retrotransposon integrase-like protein 1 [Saitoella coloradoensis]
MMPTPITPMMNEHHVQDVPIGGSPMVSPQPGGQNSKRRRVTRACDECRKKKIKCDGKKPCTHCSVYSYECTFDQPSQRRRNPAPQYIESLETRLQRMEGLLRTLLPDVDVNNPELVDLKAAMLAQRQKQQNQMPPPPPPNYGDHHHSSESSHSHSNSHPEVALSPSSTDSNDNVMESMINNVGRLTLDESGHFDFRGGSSGALFVNRVRESVFKALGCQQPADPGVEMAAINLSGAFPVADNEEEGEGFAPPAKEVAKQLCELVFNHGWTAAILHRPTFWKEFERVYKEMEEQGEEVKDRSSDGFMGVLYMMMAIGGLLGNKNQEKWGFKDIRLASYRYFLAAKNGIDTIDGADLPTLQTLILMISYLQSNSRMSTCWSYVGMGLRLAQRLGLHRNLPYRFSTIEKEVRKRVFWTLYNSDIYLSAMLGLPRCMHDADIDQEFAADVDDELITDQGIGTQPAGVQAFMAAPIAYTKLLKILSKVMSVIYPVQPKADTPTNYVAQHDVEELEHDLEEWVASLPIGMRPGVDATGQRYAGHARFLGVAYGHVRMILYRPFLHYLSRPPGSPDYEEHSFQYAKNCCKTACSIINLVEDMRSKGSLHGAYWFALFTTFFACAVLIFAVVQAQEGAEAEKALAALETGKSCLVIMSETSQTAKKCINIVEDLCISMNKYLAAAKDLKKRGQLPQVRRTASRKRRHDPPTGQGISRAHTLPANMEAGTALPRQHHLPRSQTAISHGTATSTPIASRDQSPVRQLQQYSESARASPESFQNLNHVYALAMPAQGQTFSTFNSPDTALANANFNEQFGASDSPSDNLLQMPDLNAMNAMLFPTASNYQFMPQQAAVNPNPMMGVALGDFTGFTGYTGYETPIFMQDGQGQDQGPTPAFGNSAGVPMMGWDEFMSNPGWMGNP